jgi:hypothetical protein
VASFCKASPLNDKDEEEKEEANFTPREVYPEEVNQDQHDT